MDGNGAWLLMIGLLLAGLLSLGRILPYLERRGWIQISGLGGRGRRALGSALLGVDQALAPQVRHVAKTRERVQPPKKREGEPDGGADDHTGD
jgi:hypothetical protein